MLQKVVLLVQKVKSMPRQELYRVAVSTTTRSDVITRSDTTESNVTGSNATGRGVSGSYVVTYGDVVTRDVSAVQQRSIGCGASGPVDTKPCISIFQTVRYEPVSNHTNAGYLLINDYWSTAFARLVMSLAPFRADIVLVNFECIKGKVFALKVFFSILCDLARALVTIVLSYLHLHLKNLILQDLLSCGFFKVFKDVSDVS